MEKSLEQWNKEYKEIQECRESLRRNLFTAEFALAGGEFDGFFRRMIKRHGTDAMRQVVAQSINYRRSDMRLSPHVLKWVKGVELFTHYDNNSCFFSEFIVDMNPAVMNAMAGGLIRLEMERKGTENGGVIA